jgi:hypothetical protein
MRSGANAAACAARLAAWPVMSRGMVELFANHVGDEEARLIAQVLGRVADSIPTES